MTACLAGPRAPAVMAVRRAPAFKVSSTLDGKSVLPHRIHWVARTSLAQGRVSDVAFLIDGKVRWVERDAPYTYSEDGAYLVTSWLTPGRHRFTVRVTSTDGRKWHEDRGRPRRAAPEPPAELAGSWQRDVQGTPAAIGGPPGDLHARLRASLDPGPRARQVESGHGQRGHRRQRLGPRARAHSRSPGA